MSKKIVSKTATKADNTDTVAAPDGRRLRSERSRQAIIDASVALITEGVLVPTAQQISERAGVGIRSFFRHFSDMENLFSTVDAQSRLDVEALFVGGDRNGTLEERILHAVERHADGYENQKNSQDVWVEDSNWNYGGGVGVEVLQGKRWSWKLEADFIHYGSSGDVKITAQAGLFYYW